MGYTTNFHTYNQKRNDQWTVRERDRNEEADSRHGEEEDDEELPAEPLDEEETHHGRERLRHRQLIAPQRFALDVVSRAGQPQTQQDRSTGRLTDDVGVVDRVLLGVDNCGAVWTNLVYDLGEFARVADELGSKSVT